MKKAHFPCGGVGRVRGVVELRASLGGREPWLCLSERGWGWGDTKVGRGSRLDLEEGRGGRGEGGRRDKDRHWSKAKDQSVGPSLTSALAWPSLTL